MFWISSFGYRLCVSGEEATVICVEPPPRSIAATVFETAPPILSEIALAIQLKNLHET